MRMTSDIIKLVLLLWVAAVGLTACGGGAGTESNQDGGSASGVVTGTTTNPDVLAYKKYVWDNLSSDSRCGQCHSETRANQEPVFVHTNFVEGHKEVMTPSPTLGVPRVNRASPNDSPLVTKVRNGHKPQACWLATQDDCADAIRDFIIAWVNETSGTGAEPIGVQLVAPPIRGVGESKAFPTDPTEFESKIHTPYLVPHCAGCHTPTAANPQAPFFASNDVSASYLAAQQKMDLLNPANSRFVLRLRDQFHNCWTNDCADDAQDMEDAIIAFAGTIDDEVVDPNLIVSKALTLVPPDAIIASGGERHVNNQIALWEFKNKDGSPTSTTAYDTSGVYPLMPLSLSGSYEWVGGYGVKFTNGKAQATGEASKKLLNNITSSGEYSIEAWVIPANVVQQNKNIISYSGGPTVRNFTIAQNEYNYLFYNRVTPPLPAPQVNDPNGDPVLTTLAADEDLQATQQHIVMTFDPVNGRRMYVNGVFTDDTDAADIGMTLNQWSDVFAFTLANELGTPNPWQGTFRMVAVHNRALTQAQITQNFKAGVGEKFFLLFSISHIPGVPADSYIKVQAEQFDTYSYLFNNPVYVNLGNPTPAIDFAIEGMRIGINGKEAIVGQSFINLEIDRVTSNNQEISRLGSVIQLQQGSVVDEFFLTFETLGDLRNPFIVAAPGVLADPPDLDPQSDIAVRTFSEINGAMSELTGVPTSNSAVLTAYTKLKQQLPSIENVNAFVPANIIGISQLAFEYCDRLVEDTTITGLCDRTDTTISARKCVFGDFDDFDVNAPNDNFNKTAAAAFGAINSTVRTGVADALYDRMIGVPSSLGAVLNNAPTRAQIRGELVNAPSAGDYPGNLLDRLEAAGSSTKNITKALCTSVLGSAALAVQ